VLDIASGRGGPALVLAREFGCSVVGIEIRPDFHAVAVERIAEAGLAERVTLALGDAARTEHEPESFDAVLCLGASFVYGSLADTVDTLAPAVRPGGYVVVGEPYWRRLPLLDGTIAVFETSGLPVVSVVASSEDDWDRYETLHWQAVERWLAENDEHPDRAEIRSRHERHKRNYVRHQREYLGWAIFVGWKRT
jgi:protein-L-isoaspartate O-methyltransferase